MSVIPKIRFKGFTDDWEQRKFFELYEKNVEKNTEFIGYDKTISIATMTYRNEGNGASDESLKTYKVLRVGDLAFEGHTNKEFRYGRFVTNDIGIGIMSPRFSTLRPIKDMPVSFWKHYIHYEPIMRGILVNSTKAGTMMNELVISDLMKQTIKVPSIEEQKKIGSFLNNLDKLITLHQRKCDETKELKKYMLQKMFPKNGEKVPEIRFEGFTDDWEKRKLSDCAGFRRGSFPQPYGNKDWYDGEGAMPFVQVADVSDDMKLVDDTKQKISKLAQPMSVCAEEGSVLVTLQGSIGRVAITQYKAFVDRTVLIFDKYNADIDKTFWAYIIKEKFIEEARKAPGGTIKTITKEVLSDFDLMLPSYDEQKMLGKLLHSLDHLITLHQHKCDTLKELKKYMLQNMFPKEG